MAGSLPVVFNYASWAALYPELSASVNSAQAAGYFQQAQLWCDNTEMSVVDNCAPVYERTTLLNLLVSHIAALFAPINGAPSSPLVGRISTAGEGSVSVSTEMQYPQGTVQWFNQTKYGAAFWAGSTKYRSMRYVPGSCGARNPYGRNVVRLY
jgi:hypothetical protein